MALSNEAKKKIQLFMLNMKGGDTYKFSSFTKEEADYILWLIKNQKGYSFETNGYSDKPETITKFKKLYSLEDYIKI